MNRFELERAMKRSSMPALSKALFLLYLTNWNNDAGCILPEHQPSLTQLCQDGSMSRTSVRDHRHNLEVAGWLTCTPPHPARSRRGARTHVMLHIPGSPDFHEARRGRPPSMRPEARRARAALAMEQALARKTPAQDVQSSSPRSGTVPAARPSPRAWHAAGADPLGDEAMARARARDAARRQP